MIFLNSASSAAALVFYLPFSGQSMKCTHRGKTERGQSTAYILKFSKKNTIFNEHPVEASSNGICYNALTSFFFKVFRCVYFVSLAFIYQVRPGYFEYFFPEIDIHICLFLTLFLSFISVLKTVIRRHCESSES